MMATLGPWGVAVTAVRLWIWVCVVSGLALDSTHAQPHDARRSGQRDMSPALQAMQRDDTANPAWLWLREGERRFAADCARCHNLSSMSGVAARHPAWDAAKGAPITLAGRIAQCQTQQVRGPALKPESDERLALETAIAHRSRGQPIAPPDDPRLTPWRQRGQRLYQQRLGQLDLSCQQCHDSLAGRSLGGSRIPQAHPTAYPLYRLEWQSLGSLQRRLRACFTGVRAQAPPFDDDELIALELYLMQRAVGMPIETPGVRP